MVPRFAASVRRPRWTPRTGCRGLLPHEQGDDIVRLHIGEIPLPRRDAGCRQGRHPVEAIRVIIGGIQERVLMVADLVVRVAKHG